MAENTPENVIPFDGCSDGAKPSAKQPFQLKKVGDFATLITQKWIIKPILPRAELAVIFGESGSGKSFLALDMAMAIARGKDWNNHKTSKGRVIYIAAEGAHGLKQRIMAYSMHHSIDLFSLDNFYVIAEAPNFLKNPPTAQISSIIGQADVIFIDTFARVMAGGNENAGDDVGKVIEQCQLLQASTGALIVLIHHAGKNQALGARGWSGLKAACDTEIEVTGLHNPRRITMTKQKDGQDGQQFGFTLDPMKIGTDDDGDEITSCVPVYCVPSPDEKSPTKKQKIGLIEQLILDVFERFGVTGVEMEHLLIGVTKEMPWDERKRDQRRARALQAIRGLMQRKILSITDNIVYKT